MPFWICLLFVMLLLLLNDPVSAGSCWLNVQDNGRCHGYLGPHEDSLTKEECCRAYSGSIGWSPHNPTPSHLFYWTLRGGAPDCQNCRATCADLECGPGHRCRVHHGNPRCVCSPNCRHRRQGHVCGTNMRTYRNHCHLLRYQCRRDQNVQLDYIGDCRTSCNGVECPAGEYCVHDQNGLPHCVRCNMFCPEVTDTSQYQCGADGITYESICHLMRATCLSGRSIGIAYNGECQGSLTCATLSCSGGKLCLVNQESGRPQCVVCKMDGCTHYEGQSQLCGTDNVTYSSWCHLQETACKQGYVIKTEHFGACGTSADVRTEVYEEEYVDHGDPPPNPVANNS